MSPSFYASFRDKFVSKISIAGEITMKQEQQ